MVYAIMTSQRFITFKIHSLVSLYRGRKADTLIAKSRGVTWERKTPTLFQAISENFVEKDYLKEKFVA